MSLNLKNENISDFVKNDSEKVLVNLNGFWKKGLRSNFTTWKMGCIGRVVCTEDEEIYHSFLNSSVKSFNREEIIQKINSLELELKNIKENLNYLNNES